MDVSASLRVPISISYDLPSPATQTPPPAIANAPTPAALAAPDVDAANEPSTPSASAAQLSAVITVAPSAPRSVIIADIGRLPPSIRYAPSNPPHDATVSALFDTSA